MKFRNVIAALVVAACLWVGCSSAFAAGLVWQHSKTDAFALAKSQGKKVLLLVGSRCCDGTLFMRDTACELVSPVNIKGLIEQRFIPWYGGAAYTVKGCVGDPLTSDWYDYAPLGMFTMPLVAVIDPNTDKRLYSSTGITPRVVEDASKFDNQKFYSLLAQYTTEIPVICAYTIDPTSSLSFSSSPHPTPFGDVGNTGTVAVTPSVSSCTWSATSNASWIKITAGSAGTGNGTVSYSVSANTTGSTRTGTMAIAGKTFTVTQSGATPPITPPVTNAALYFPHIATSIPWQTEIAIINTSGQAVTGTLRGLSDAGQLIETKAVTFSAHGRRQVIVANEFTNHADIGYITFDTASAAVQGYTKFYQAGKYSAAIPAAKTGTKSGVFAKIEKNGWTGIAFVNTEADAASVTLTAYNDAGAVVATQVLIVSGYAKGVNNPELMFTQDIRNATYIVYSSDKNVVGFQLNGSSDGTMLDALPGLDGFNAI